MMSSYMKCSAVVTQADQPIPSYFSGNDNCHLKGKNSRETKMRWMEDPTFATSLPNRAIFKMAEYCDIICKILF